MEPTLRGKQRVAFFGGSFDPPHEGHLSVARAARAALGLDAVFFAPVGAQPLKPDGPTAGFEDRVAMTGLAIAGESAFAVTRIDAPKPSAAPNYTVDTLLRLRAELPAGGILFCLMGADSFLGLHRWHHAAEIPLIAPLIVASRPGQPLDDLKAALPQGLKILEDSSSASQQQLAARIGPEVQCVRIVSESGEAGVFYVLPSLHVDISASQIREEIRATFGGKPSASFSSDPFSSGPLTPRVLPEAVAAYIRMHGLYR